MHNMIVQPLAVRVSVLLIVILFLIGQNKCDSHGEGSEGYSPSHESEVVQVSQNQVWSMACSKTIHVHQFNDFQDYQYWCFDVQIHLESGKVENAEANRAEGLQCPSNNVITTRYRCKVSNKYRSKCMNPLSMKFSCRFRITGATVCGPAAVRTSPT